MLRLPNFLSDSTRPLCASAHVHKNWTEIDPSFLQRVDEPFGTSVQQDLTEKGHRRGEKEHWLCAPEGGGGAVEQLGSGVGLQTVLLSSSPPALYLVFSCFVFTVENT